MPKKNQQKWLTDQISGDWKDKDTIIECVLVQCLFDYVDSVEEAEDFIKRNRLKTTKRKSYSGDKNYKGGYFSMDYEVATKL